MMYITQKFILYLKNKPSDLFSFCLLAKTLRMYCTGSSSWILVTFKNHDRKLSLGLSSFSSSVLCLFFLITKPILVIHMCLHPLCGLDIHQLQYEVVCVIKKWRANNREACFKQGFFFWSVFKIKYELQNVQQEQHNKNLIKWRFEIESDATAVVSGSSCQSHFRRPTICTCYSVTVSAGFSLACNEGQRTGQLAPTTDLGNLTSRLRPKHRKGG